MKVLITGGAGGIGPHMVMHLMKNTDWKITVWDSLMHGGNIERLQTIMPWPGDRFRFEKVDLNDEEIIERDEQFDIIIHLAALSDVLYSVRNPHEVVSNNIMSTLNMLEYAARRTPTKFIYFSTDEVFGPFKPEIGIHWPSNPYSASKAAGEDLCNAYSRAGKVPVIITNTTNNFGEMQRTDKYPAMLIKKIYRNEVVQIHQMHNRFGSRYYIHSRNVADAVLHILTNDKAETVSGNGKRFSIADPRARVNNYDFAKMIADMFRKELLCETTQPHTENPAHDHEYYVNTDLLLDDWEPPVSFEESLQRTVEWSIMNPQWLVDFK